MEGPKHLFLRHIRIRYRPIYLAETGVIIRQLDLQQTMQSVHITTKVVSSNPAHNEVHAIRYYVLKFVSDLRQVGVFSGIS